MIKLKNICGILSVLKLLKFSPVTISKRGLEAREQTAGYIRVNDEIYRISRLVQARQNNEANLKDINYIIENLPRPAKRKISSIISSRPEGLVGVFVIDETAPAAVLSISNFRHHYDLLIPLSPVSIPGSIEPSLGRRLGVVEVYHDHLRTLSRTLRRLYKDFDIGYLKIQNGTLGILPPLGDSLVADFPLPEIDGRTLGIRVSRLLSLISPVRKLPFYKFKIELYERGIRITGKETYGILEIFYRNEPIP